MEKVVTRLGLYLTKKAINKVYSFKNNRHKHLSIKSMSINPKTHLRIQELYLIALAIEVNPSELLDFVCNSVKLPKDKAS